MKNNENDVKLIEVNRAAVLKKINRSENDLDYQIEQMLNWYKKQPHLPPSINRAIFEYVLLQHKFNVEKAIIYIDKHYTMKHVLPEVFDNWDLTKPDVIQSLNTCAWLPLYEMTENCERVTIFRLLNDDPKLFNPWDIIKCYYIVASARVKQNDLVAGEHFVFDMSNFKTEHFLKFLTPSFQKKHKILMEGKTPVIIKGLHYLNMPAGLDILFKFIKLLLKPKMLDRVHVHNDFASFHKIIPKEMLPKDYGGEKPAYKDLYDKCLKILIKYNDLYVSESKLRSDESKRIGHSKYINCDSLVGEDYDGLFRKLEID